MVHGHGKIIYFSQTSGVWTLHNNVCLDTMVWQRLVLCDRGNLFLDHILSNSCCTYNHKGLVRTFRTSAIADSWLCITHLCDEDTAVPNTYIELYTNLPLNYGPSIQDSQLAPIVSTVELNNSSPLLILTYTEQTCMWIIIKCVYMWHVTCIPHSAELYIVHGSCCVTKTPTIYRSRLCYSPTTPKMVHTHMYMQRSAYLPQILRMLVSIQKCII